MAGNQKAKAHAKQETGAKPPGMPDLVYPHEAPSGQQSRHQPSPSNVPYPPTSPLGPDQKAKESPYPSTACCPSSHWSMHSQQTWAVRKTGRQHSCRRAPNRAGPGRHSPAAIRLAKSSACAPLSAATVQARPNPYQWDQKQCMRLPERSHWRQHGHRPNAAAKCVSCNQT